MTKIYMWFIWTMVALTPVAISLDQAWQRWNNFIVR